MIVICGSAGFAVTSAQAIDRHRPAPYFLWTSSSQWSPSAISDASQRVPSARVLTSRIRSGTETFEHSARDTSLGEEETTLSLATRILGKPKGASAARHAAKPVLHA